MTRDKSYKPIDSEFHNVLKKTVNQRIYSKIQYFTEIHEFITANTMIQNFTTENGEEFILLLSGDKIRLDKIVTINGQYAPQYAYIKDYTCDC